MATTFFLILLGTLLVQGSFGLEITPIGRLPYNRTFCGSAYDGEDSVFITGGMYSNLYMFPDILKYNITSNEVTKVSDLPEGVTNAALATDESGTVYHTGGLSESSEFWSIVYAFNTTHPNPVAVGELPTYTSAHTATSDGNGYIYITGSGYDDPTQIWRYDTRTGTTETVGHILRHISYQVAAFVHDSLYVFGGWMSDVGESSTDILKFNTTTGETTVLDQQFLPSTTMSSAMTVGDDIYIVGGQFDDNVANAEVFRLAKFNTVTETLEELEVTNYPHLHYSPHAVYIPKYNRIYVFGGSHLINIDLDQIFYIQL